MITTPLFYVVGPHERAYLSQSRRFWIRPFTKGNPGGYTPKSIGLFNRKNAMAILRSLPDAWGQPAEPIEVRLAPRCQCCGNDEFRAKLVDPTERPWRCYKHRERNPCAIEGCGRTTAAPENSELPDADGRLRNDQWICSEHWRKYVPARSRRRRAYHAFFRLARRYGWDFVPPGSRRNLNAQFWIFWDTLIANARHKAEHGYINTAEIERLFG